VGKGGSSLNQLVQKGESNEERKKKREKSYQNTKNMNMVERERLVSGSLNQFILNQRVSLRERSKRGIK
jgi:hypothetical protein